MNHGTARSASIESLESRRLLAAAGGPYTSLGAGTTVQVIPQPFPSATLTSRGTLLITGTDTADQITITQIGKEVRVSLGQGDIIDSSVFAAGNVKRLRVDAGAGDDEVRSNALVKPTTIMGGAYARPDVLPHCGHTPSGSTSWHAAAGRHGCPRPRR